jgi:small-conductance mechanosensitive channel
VLGSKIIEQTVNEADTQALEAENKRLEQEIRREQLRAERQPQTAASDQYMQLLTDQLNKLQDRLDDANIRASEAEKTVLGQRLDMITGEMQRLQSQQPEKVDMVSQMRENLETARALLEFFNPTGDPPPPTEPKGDSPELTAWMMRSKFEQQRWEAERADRHALAMAQVEVDREDRTEKRRIDEERSKRMDRFLTETAPKVVEVAAQVLQAFTNGRGLSIGAVAPQVAQPQVPQGMDQAECQTCHNIMTFNPDLPQVMCNVCGAIYQLKGDPNQQQSQHQAPQEEYAVEEGEL